MTNRYENKAPSEVITLGMDFNRLLISGETITSAVVDIAVVSGEDASAADMLAGDPSITGSKINFLVSSGVDGVEYVLSVTAATSQGNTYLEIGYLRVRNKP